MTREEAVAYFKDMNGCTYGDVEPIQMTINALDKCDKIQQIISDWGNVPWATSRTIMQDTLLKIADVLEKEEV